MWTKYLCEDSNVKLVHTSNDQQGQSIQWYTWSSDVIYVCLKRFVTVFQVGARYLLHPFQSVEHVTAQVFSDLVLGQSDVVCDNVNEFIALSHVLKTALKSRENYKFLQTL